MRWLDFRKWRAAIGGGLLLTGSLLIALVLRSSAESAYAGRPLHAWTAQWLEGGFAERVAARQALAGVGPEALPALIGMLEARERTWRVAARRWANGRWPGVFRTPLPASGLQSVAAQLLRQLGPAAAPAAPALVRLLDARQFPAAGTAHDTLVALGEPVLPAVLAGLRSPAPGIVSNAATVLDEMLPGDRLATALPGLIEAVAAGSPEARAGVARPLVRAAATGLDPRARAAVRQLARDPDPLVQRSVLQRNADFRDQSALPPETLRAFLDHPDITVRLSAAESLWWSGADREAALSTLTNLLREPTHTWQAALVLGRLGPAAQAAVPALVEAVRREPAHRPDRTPATSAMALARLGEVALPGLLELLEDDELGVRFSAAQAAVPELEHLAATRRGYPQAAASEALAAIVPDAELPGTTGENILADHSGDRDLPP